MNPLSKIKYAIKKGILVRIERRVENGYVDGYILETGRQFFLMLVVGNNIYYEGFQIFRISDVTQVWTPAPHAMFIEKALQLRKLRRPRKPSIDLSTIQTLLISASKHFSLVTIHQEKKDPDVCYIGRVESTNSVSFVLLEIDSDASWRKEPTTYKYATITRIDFGGPYEEALALVGGS